MDTSAVADAAQVFTAVYEAHHRQVYAYAVARVGRALADEVVADTFLVAWRRYPSLPRGEPLPWLLAVARNMVRDRYLLRASAPGAEAPIRRSCRYHSPGDVSMNDILDQLAAARPDRLDPPG